MDTVLYIFVALLLIKLVTELVLEQLNLLEVKRNRAQVPEAFKGVMDEETYKKSVDYTIAKIGFNRFVHIYEALILGAVVYVGALPFLYAELGRVIGTGLWAQALILVVIMMLLEVPNLPLSWWYQFRLEERFGFNKSTKGLWISDRLKGVALFMLLGVPLVWGLLKFVDAFPFYWWFWGFALFFGFQLLMMVLYPIFILRLFNKLTPLEEGELRTRLFALADKLGFEAKDIEVMDGSKRSSHSNAFFTGFGKMRKIVLFDTLIEQLSIEELEAVLAHEIGHYKRGHVIKLLTMGAVVLLAGFGALGRLAMEEEFYSAFGFDIFGGVAPAFLLFAILAGLVTFWVGPLMHYFSRRYEYEADAFAREGVGGPDPLIRSLRRLSQKNLSNLTPHWLYSMFHYSHPTLLERERALRDE